MILLLKQKHVKQSGKDNFNNKEVIMTQEEGPKIETINFDGEAYAVEDLTPRVIDGFNTLVRLQQDVQEQAYQLKKSQSAQGASSVDIKAMVTEDKIKPLEETIIDDASPE